MTETRCGEPEELLPTEAAGRFLTVGPQTMRKWRHQGKGPRYYRLGDSPRGRALYRRSDLIAWLDARTFSNTSEETERAAERRGRP